MLIQVLQYQSSVQGRHYPDSRSTMQFTQKLIGQKANFFDGEATILSNAFCDRFAALNEIFA
jgi:hypothetical protein